MSLLSSSSSASLSVETKEGGRRRAAAALEMRYVTAAKAEGGKKERGTVRCPRCVCLFVLGLHYGRRRKVRSLVRTLGQVMQPQRGKMGGEGSTNSLKRLLICGLLRDASTEGKKEGMFLFPTQKKILLFLERAVRKGKRNRKTCS